MAHIANIGQVIDQDVIYSALMEAHAALVQRITHPTRLTNNSGKPMMTIGIVHAPPVSSGCSVRLRGSPVAKNIASMGRRVSPERCQMEQPAIIATVQRQMLVDHPMLASAARPSRPPSAQRCRITMGTSFASTEVSCECITAPESISPVR